MEKEENDYKFYVCRYPDILSITYGYTDNNNIIINIDEDLEFKELKGLDLKFKEEYAYSIKNVTEGYHQKAAIIKKMNNFDFDFDINKLNLFITLLIVIKYKNNYYLMGENNGVKLDIKQLDTSNDYSDINTYEFIYSSMEPKRIIQISNESININEDVLIIKNKK